MYKMDAAKSVDTFAANPHQSLQPVQPGAPEQFRACYANVNVYASQFDPASPYRPGSLHSAQHFRSPAPALLPAQYPLAFRPELLSPTAHERRFKHFSTPVSAPQCAAFAPSTPLKSETSATDNDSSLANNADTKVDVKLVHSDSEDDDAEADRSDSESVNSEANTDAPASDAKSAAANQEATSSNEANTSGKKNGGTSKSILKACTRCKHSSSPFFKALYL